MLRRWWCRCGWAAGLLAGGPHKRGVTLSATLSATLSNTLSEESPRSLRWGSGGAPVGRRTGAGCADAALTRRVIYLLRLYGSAAACGGRRACVFLSTRCKQGPCCSREAAVAAARAARRRRRWQRVRRWRSSGLRRVAVVVGSSISWQEMGRSGEEQVLAAAAAIARCTHGASAAMVAPAATMAMGRTAARAGRRQQQRQLSTAAASHGSSS